MADDYPARPRFARLTAREERLGVLDANPTIGTRDGWSRTLSDHPSPFAVIAPSTLARRPPPLPLPAPRAGLYPARPPPTPARTRTAPLRLRPSQTTHPLERHPKAFTSIAIPTSPQSRPNSAYSLSLRPHPYPTLTLPPQQLPPRRACYPTSGNLRSLRSASGNCFRYSSSNFTTLSS